MKHACFLVAAAAVALLGLAAPAHASHGDGLQCGDTIETAGTVRLQSDLDCTTTGGFGYGIFIGASNVNLSLGGHTIQTFSGGILSSLPPGTPLSNVHIRGGAGGTATITATDTPSGGSAGVALPASNSSVAGLRIAAGAGIELDGNGNEVFRNVIDISAGNYGGVRVWGQNNHIHRNTVRGNTQTAIGVFSDSDSTANGARVAVNRVECAAGATGVPTGIRVTGYTTSAIVARNTVLGCDAGITLELANFASGGAQVRRNVSTGNRLHGISLSDPAGRVWCNETHSNEFDGIVTSGGVVENNRANNNGGWGINATGATDLGGNTATGNATDQDCTPNIVCTTPPDPPCAAAGGVGA